MTEIAPVQWSMGKSSDLMVDVWSTEAAIEAVLSALLADPENLAKAVRILQGESPGLG